MSSHQPCGLIADKVLCLNFQDTFDIRICLAKSIKFVIDFQTAEETDLHVIDIPLNFAVMQGGMIHGLAFWFEVGFLGSE